MENSKHLTSEREEQLPVARKQVLKSGFMASLVDTTSFFNDDDFDENNDVYVGTGERDAQEYIINYLVKNNGFVRGEKNNPINPRTGLDINTFIKFIQATQPHVWEYFTQYSEPAKELEALLKEEKESRGTLALLRDGIPQSNSRPAVTVVYNDSSMNEELKAKWGQNIWTIYDEVKYETVEKPTRRIDLMIGVNGVPFQAVELKNELTGQSVGHAEEQFKSTRSNLEPLLKPVTGCITYFSMSRRSVRFTTVLNGAATKFLPFNKGSNGGKGNPPVDDKPELHGFRTHYMLDELWTRECLTDIIFNFMYVDTNGRSFKQYIHSELTKVGVYFPRYHQLRTVRNIVKYVSNSEQLTEVFNRFLIQHSAGSGKTLTIAWLAHQLVRLMVDGESVFDSVIVVTDRVAIVRQLEHVIRMINKHDGLIAEVKTSKDLKKAIADGKKIIVSTVQKFGKLREYVKDLEKTKDKNFALMIDEAHSGQTGENASAIVDVLGSSLADDIAETLDGIPNITYVAFTATPKPETLMKFGVNNEPFDLYSMKQAIEEGQILNVLKNYISHEIFNKVYNTGDDKNLPSSIYAKRAMNSYVRSSKENLSYKVAVILEHMVSSTLPNIGGLGRGMVVVSSRQDVYKYVKEMERQIELYPELYSAVKPMGAYTMKINVDGVEVDDAMLNGFKDTEIPRRLSEENLESPTMRNLLVVADKYQTGFDEPLLCSMYVDKKLSGITAVQTLSRLNRIRPQNDKEDVTVIDFQDNEKDVRDAFAKYNVEARVKTHASLTDLEASSLALYAYGMFTSTEIDSYYQASLNVKTDRNASTIMSNIVNNVLDRVEDYMESQDRNVKEAFENFKYEVRNFVEDFVFVSQFKPVVNPNLRGLHLFLKLLLKLMATPRSGVADNSWLENIKVEIAHTIVVSKNISGNLVAPEKSEKKERTGASHNNPNDYDRPTTVDELVKEYNEQLKTLIFALNGVKSGEDGNYTQNQLDEYNLTVFDTIIATAVADTRLEEYSHNRSSQRFDSEQTRIIVNEIILKALVEDKIANKNNPDYINLPAMYNNNEEFADRIQTYVLSSTYQILLRNRLSETPQN